ALGLGGTPGFSRIRPPSSPGWDVGEDGGEGGASWARSGGPCPWLSGAPDVRGRWGTMTCTVS
ncbi:unnamed protein product, partial [Musa textilis]